MWRKIIGNKLLVTKKCGKVFWGKSSIYGNSRPVPSWLNIWLLWHFFYLRECQLTVENLQGSCILLPLYASILQNTFHFFILEKFQIRTLCLWHGLMMLKINFKSSFFYLLCEILWIILCRAVIKFANDIFVFLTPHYSNKKNSISVFFCWEVRKTYLAYVG